MEIDRLIAIRTAGCRLEERRRNELRRLDLRSPPADRRHARGWLRHVLDRRRRAALGGRAGRTLSLNRVAMVGTAAIIVGLVGTIALGVWLAILRPELRPWHGWAIAAIVLWAIAAAAVLRSFVEYAKPVAEGKRADRCRPDRPERRADGAEPHIDRAPASRPGLGSRSC